MATYGYVVCDMCGKFISQPRYGCDLGGGITVYGFKESSYQQDYQLRNICDSCLIETVKYLEQKRKKKK